MDALLVKLILGGYVFAAGAYAWAWLLYVKIADRVTNHQAHELALLTSRIAHLEKYVGHRLK